jgi:hypothetical protein
MSLFGIFEIYKSIDSLLIITSINSSNIYNISCGLNKGIVLNESLSNSLNNSCPKVCKFDCSKSMKSISKFPLKDNNYELILSKVKHITLKLFLVIAISLSTIFREIKLNGN